MKITSSLSGHFTMVAVNAETGAVRRLAEFENLILDQGLNRIGTGGISGYCRVGSGSTPPSNTDAALVSQVAAQSQTSDSYGVQNSAPYFGWARWVHRFPAGAAAGNLSEVGIGWSSTGSTLFSRALIKDVNGDPTTITVLSNEFLDVTYELRIYPPAADSTFQCVVAGITHDCVLRASSVTDYWNWGVWIGTNAQDFDNPASSTDVHAYSGAIGSVAQDPSGTNSGGNLASAAYSNNSLKRTAVASWDLNSGNFGSGGIQSVRFSTRAGTYQCSFTPAIMKDNTKTLALNLETSWARKTL